MAFNLIDLPYGDLAPAISAETLSFHHGKHHQTYIDKMNAAIDGTPHAEAALEAVKDAFDTVHYGVPTKPGRLVLVDNRLVLHARHPYAPKYDGMDRWLQRMMVTESLWPLLDWQKNSRRILTP